MCHHTREPTVLSRVSCRPATEHCTFSPALPVTLAHLPRQLKNCSCSGQGKVRTVVPVPRGGHLHVSRPPDLPSFSCVSLDVLGHADQTVPRQDVNSPFSPARATSVATCLHTRRFGTLAGPPPPVFGLPWEPYPPGSKNRHGL